MIEPDIFNGLCTANESLQNKKGNGDTSRNPLFRKGLFKGRKFQNPVF
jgi:hypothetical protein